MMQYPSLKSSIYVVVIQSRLFIASLPSYMQSKEEVMAVRLREADSMAAMAELRQKVSDLEIQVCKGLVIYDHFQ